MGMTVLAFLVALTVVIFVHEYGHYRAALAFKVRVVRFSIGFGRPLWRWQRLQPGIGLPTEFTVCAIPLGGFIKMLDARDQQIDSAELPFAFSSQPLRAKAIIVAAGPVANLVLTFCIYACLQWLGGLQALPVIATPIQGSVADSAGLRSGDWIRQFSINGEDGKEVHSFEHLSRLITTAVNDQDDFELEVASTPNGVSRLVSIQVAGLEIDRQRSVMTHLGLSGPLTQPVIIRVIQGGPADQAGLKPGDKVLKVDHHVVNDGQHLIQFIRSAPSTQLWEVLRDDKSKLLLPVQPAWRELDGKRIAKIDAVVGSEPQTVWVQQSFVDGLQMALDAVLTQTIMTFQAVGKLVSTATGWQQLSGPLTMAEYAGKTAEQGWRPFVQFVALISLSVGLLNLLPIPVLDGGHLMYYLWESVMGRAPSPVWLERLQVMGLSVLALMMFTALLNDVLRWLT